MTDDMIQLLSQAAEAAAKQAYCPYSKFHVGCCLLMFNNEIITGCNVENASYGLTICSERCAIFNAVAKGFRRGDIVALAVACPDAAADGIVDYRMPCGACRQVMTEFLEPSTPIIVVGVGQFTMDELLPKAFRLF